MHLIFSSSISTTLFYFYVLLPKIQVLVNASSKEPNKETNVADIFEICQTDKNGKIGDNAKIVLVSLL